MFYMKASDKPFKFLIPKPKRKNYTDLRSIVLEIDFSMASFNSKTNEWENITEIGPYMDFIGPNLFDCIKICVGSRRIYFNSGYMSQSLCWRKKDEFKFFLSPLFMYTSLYAKEMATVEVCGNDIIFSNVEGTQLCFSIRNLKMRVQNINLNIESLPR